MQIFWMQIDGRTKVKQHVSQASEQKKREKKVGTRASRKFSLFLILGKQTSRKANTKKNVEKKGERQIDAARGPDQTACVTNNINIVVYMRDNQSILPVSLIRSTCCLHARLITSRELVGNVLTRCAWFISLVFVALLLNFDQTHGQTVMEIVSK